MSSTTLKDVGDWVGVSAKTVSNVVNNTGWVRQDLKDRIQAAIIELGYRPNVAARHLRNGRSGMITLAVPDVAQPYFAALASAIVAAAAERSITVLINQTNGTADAERRISEGIGAPLMDGLILSPLALSADDFASRIDTTPIVLLGEHIGSSLLPHVAVDNTAAACAATEHLIASGRRRIAAIGDKRLAPKETADLRLGGYCDALASGGIALDERLVIGVEEFGRADGMAAANTLIESGVDFDAVFAFNDLMALGAMHTLIGRGYQIPEDVAIIGFDDIEEGRYSRPSLSTVSPDMAAIAHTALDLILRPAGAEERHESVPDTTIIPFKIVERAST